MEKDLEIPIILVFPFLAIGRALINVQKDELTMKMKDKKVTFNVFKTIKFLNNDNINYYFSIDVINELANSMHIDMCSNDSLEYVLVSFVSTLDKVHDTHFGPHIHVKEYLSAKIHRSIE